MNKLLQKLADQCRTEYRDGHSGFTEQFDEEKFAELIVRECAYYVEQDQGSGDVLSSRMKQHFGVEE